MEKKNYILGGMTDAEFHYNSEAGRVDIAGIACHWGKENLNSQVVDKNSFGAFMKLYNAGKIRPVCNYEHDSAKRIGLIDKIDMQDDGMWIEAHINTRIPYVSEWLLPLIEAGDLKGLSTEGFPLNGYESLMQMENGLVYVKDFILSAIAITAIPADWDAEFSIANYIEGWKALRAEDEAKRNAVRLGLIM